MHISTTKIAFSVEEAFNYLLLKDPVVFSRMKELLAEYADELYSAYPGSQLTVSPVSTGMQIKQCGVPIFFETTGNEEQFATLRF